MDNFYDINDFIVFLFKKWKTIIVIMLLGAVAFAGNRAVSMAGSYAAQSENAPEQPVETSADSGEPMWIKIQNIIEITPGQEEDTETSKIIDAYRKLSSSSSVLDDISGEWYESEKEENKARIEKFHDYGYILDKEVDYPYALRDFYSQFLVNNEDLNTATRTQYTYSENYIALGFKSTNEELAGNIADAYTERLTEAVQASAGEFSYRIVDRSVLYDLPTASTGTQTTRVTSSSSASSVITINQIIVQCVKGVIWGAMIGAVAAVIIVFLMYMMTRKLYLLSDTKKFSVPVLGAGFYKEKGFVKLRAGFHTALEGGHWDETGHRKLVKRIAELAEADDADKEIYVSGTCRPAYIKKIVQELNEASSGIRFRSVEGIQASGKAAGIAKKENTAFILVEKFGESVKDNIEYEITELNRLGTEILGMIVLE